MIPSLSLASQCDEAKPECRRCKGHGLLCNFRASIPDLENVTPGSHNQAFELVNMLQRRSCTLVPVNQAMICSDGVVAFEMSAQSMSGLERFRNRTLGSFSVEMTEVWRNRMPYIAFQVGVRSLVQITEPRTLGVARN